MDIFERSRARARRVPFFVFVFQFMGLRVTFYLCCRFVRNLFGAVRMPWHYRAIADALVGRTNPNT